MEQFTVDLVPNRTDLVVMRFVGELDLAAADYAEFEALAAMRGTSGNIVIDLSELVYCDSSGVRTLVHIHRHVEAAGRRLLLRCPRRAVQRVFDVLAVNDLFWIEDGDDVARGRPRSSGTRWRFTPRRRDGAGPALPPTHP
jgi:anti-anti-sigma factor